MHCPFISDLSLARKHSGDMQKRSSWLMTLFCLLNLSLVGLADVQAQIDFFDQDPDKFISAFSSELNRGGKELGAQAAREIQSIWADPKLTIGSKEAFIETVNKMVSRRISTEAGLAVFTLTCVDLIDGSTFVEIPLTTYQTVTQQCVEELAPKRTQKYLSVMYRYIQDGYPIERERFLWGTSQPDPQLAFEVFKQEEGAYKAPVLNYTATDLWYYTLPRRDSTRINQTTGKFFPLSMNFIGQGGTATWEKVELPGDEVYVELGAYDINLNFGLVKADSVTFYYTSLLNEPLEGSFEDRAVAYKDLKKANYPYFKSHSGGVVIENFIPNVRYEGGFSLQGRRKIGSAFDIVTAPIVDESGYTGSILIEAETKDDTYTDDAWATEESSASTWDTDEDPYDPSEESWDSSLGDDGWGFSDEGIPLVEHVPAKLEIQRQDQTVMKLTGEAFVLDEERMLGKGLAATIYTSAEDSIFHPFMEILYTGEDSTVILKKPKSSIYGRVPFTSSYHKFYFYLEAIIWDLRTDYLQFTAFIDKENKAALSESFDYFTMARFNQYKGLLRVNPIGAIYRYHLRHKGDAIFPENIMKDYKMPEQTKAFEKSLPALEGSGFITYNPESGEITPLPKLYSWARKARNKEDFDAIQIISKVSDGNHAALNLETMEIIMGGVSGFSMSDSVFVRVVPADTRVAVQKDRDLEFGGTVAAGTLLFYANADSGSTSNFHFDYESYSILCDSVDSIRFNLIRPESEPTEEDPLRKALSNTVFEGVSGAIHIDNPNNKSGRKNYPIFPVFDSYSQSYLYWADPDIEGGVYTKDKLFYAVDPFVLDSLEAFDPSGLQFDGEFFSSEIFPKFRQQLQVMEDFTLGFRTQAPPNGYRVYENKGKFKNEIILDRRGLRGNGEIEYLGTIARSDSFVFHFDSVMAIVNYFNLKKGYKGGVYFPQVDANSALYKWFTKEDKLSITSTEYEKLSLFEGQAEFNGTLSITENGMVGDGELTIGVVRIAGDSLLFNEMDFEADRSDFIVTDKNNPDEVIFVARNVDIEYDVRKHLSSFVGSAISPERATFPIHKFETNLAKGVYNRKKETLELNGLSDKVGGKLFAATDAERDSLMFVSEDAIYDLESKEIRISGVPQINIADATITPDSQKVVIQYNEKEQTGRIRTLKNAVIEADRETKLHKIYDATVDIYTGNEYEGAGKYDYIKVNNKDQFIQFNNIEVGSSNNTIASGVITEEDEFYLTERIFFRGETRLDATRKFLEFKGEVKIESENPVFKGAWFTFERTIVNPDSVFIPIASNLTNDLDEPLTVGLNYIPEANDFYTTFLQPQEDEDDLVVLSTSGGLTFDRKKKEFRIGSREKLRNQVYKGSTVSFNDSINTITASGYLKFPFDFEDKTLMVKHSGAWTEDLDKREMSTNLVMGINMDILPEAQMEKLAETFGFVTMGSPNIDFNERPLQEALAELLDEDNKGEKETKKFVDNVKNSMVFTDIKVAEQLPFTLLLSGVNYKYDERDRTLYHDGAIGLIGIQGKPVNKQVNAKIVYEFGDLAADGEKSHDKLTIYLEIDEFNWVFFEFEEDELKTVSPYLDSYNVPLEEAIIKRKSDEGFHFEMARDDDKQQFIQDFIQRFIRN